MKTLFLLRHAKSSWDDPRLSDHDRPLNQRGINAAIRIGRLMVERGFIPEMILCSTSVRTRATVDLVIEASGFEPDIIYDDRIYEASLGDLLAVLSDHDRDRILVVCHNPGIESLIFHLTGVIEPMPTAALAILVQTEGTEFRFRLTDVFRPRELMASD